MAYNSLGNYYQLSFSFIFVNKFCDMNTYENMYPFELQLYTTMLKNHYQEESDKRKQQDSLLRKMT